VIRLSETKSEAKKQRLFDLILVLHLLHSFHINFTDYRSLLNRLAFDDQFFSIYLVYTSPITFVINIRN